MIPEYINDWIYVLENMSMDNTYKVAWGKAILECIKQNKITNQNDSYFISFDSISEKMIKYYWDQCFFFHLKQGPYKDKEPVILGEAKKLIDIYKEITGSAYPEWFDKAVTVIKKKKDNEYHKVIKNASKALHDNVSYRFLNVKPIKKDLYIYRKKIDYIEFTLEQINYLKEYNYILIELFNYKWSLKLEQFNYAPKIVDKINGVSNSDIRRKSLKKYKELLISNLIDKEVVDFYTGENLENENISIYHVIPWSFMYSDDLWNLVVTSNSNNSQKSNMIPSEKTIEKLKLRNQNLYEKLDDNKYKAILKEAIENNYVDKFYFNCKNGF